MEAHLLHSVALELVGKTDDAWNVLIIRRKCNLYTSAYVSIRQLVGKPDLAWNVLIIRRKSNLYIYVTFIHIYYITFIRIYYSTFVHI